MADLLTDLQVEELQYLIKKAEKDKQISTISEEEWLDNLLTKLRNQKAKMVAEQKDYIGTVVKLMQVEVDDLKKSVGNKDSVEEQSKRIIQIEYYCRQWRNYAAGLKQEEADGNN